MYDYETPEAPKEKCFEFDIEVTSKVKGYVWAKDIEQAYQLILDKKWEEITDEHITDVNSIDRMEVDKNAE